MCGSIIQIIPMSKADQNDLVVQYSPIAVQLLTLLGLAFAQTGIALG
jgi:hypothetical protein